MKKRFFAAVLAAILILTVASAVSAEDESKISVDNAAAKPGEKVEVAVRISDNPGIAAFRVRVLFDSDILTFTGITKGQLLEQGFFASNGEQSSAAPRDKITAAWVYADGINEDGVLFTLSFTVADTAPDGETQIRLELSEVLDKNNTSVDVADENGTVTVRSFIYGDVNTDGDINTADLIKLLQYIAEYDGVTLSANEMKAADVYKTTADRVDMQDVLMLAQYVAEWEGIVLGAHR